MVSDSDFKETELGPIPKDWDLKRVADIVKVNEKNINKTFSSDLIGYIDVSSVDNGIIKEIKEINLKEAPSRAKRIVKDNDILISTVRPNLKHFAHIKKTKPNTIASTGFAVISAKKVNPNFLYYYLTTDNYTKYLVSIADSHTSTYPAFNPDVIEKSFVPFPSIPEQNSISQVLSDLDSKIELNQRMNRTLEEIGRAIFKHWFVDFEFPDGYGRPYKSSGGEMVDSELGKIPQGWKVGKVEDCLELIYGKGLPQKKRESGKVPVYGSNGLIGYHNNSFVKGPGIIIGRKGTVGEINITYVDFWPIDTTYYVKSKVSNVLLSWYYLLKSLKLDKMNVHSAVPGLNRNDVYETLIPILDKKLLIEFEKLIRLLHTEINQNEKQIKNLSQIRDSLLPKLMSGKIRLD